MAKNNQLSKAAQERIKNYEAKSTVQESRKKQFARDNRIYALGALVTLVIALGSQLGFAAIHPIASPTPTTSTASTPSPTANSEIPSAALAENRTWSGSMDINGGKLAFELDGTKAPQAVANFITLAKKGFYEGLTCHRLTTENMYVLQCGDPNGDGTGGPGYSFGPIENAPTDNIYKEGVIAMARQGGNAATQGSQFFIVYKDTQLGTDSAGGYTVFGKVTSGLQVVKAIADLGTTDGSGDGKPKNAVSISSVKVK